MHILAHELLFVSLLYMFYMKLIMHPEFKHDNQSLELN